MESLTVQAQVARTIKNPPPVSVSEVGSTNVVNVSVNSVKRRTAAQAANAYAAAYLAVQQYQSNSALTQASKIVQDHINSVASQIAALDQQIAGATGTSTVASLEAQLPSLENEQSTYQSELAQYQFYESLNTGGGQVISSAKIPSAPSYPKPIEYGIIAGIIGLILGTGIILLMEYFDDRIRSTSELKQLLGALPTLATIPEVEEWKNAKDAILVTLEDSHSPAAEAYRSLRTAIQFSGLDRPNHLVQFTSPTASDGKTTTLANTALTLSQSGLRVVVVCCDLRRPRIHEFFGLRNEVGFTSVLLGAVSLVDALQDVPQCPGLHLLASGPKPPNPSELLASNKSRKLLESLSDLADIVLVDSPPVLPVTDPTVIAGYVGSVVLVSSLGISTRSGITASLEKLARVHAPLIGVVLNRVPVSDQYPYYKYVYEENGK
jgi:succinoglycan biosynthesis transport protein ExoP